MNAQGNLLGCTTVQQVYQHVKKLLEQCSQSPSLDARLLVCNAAQITYENFVAYPDRPISELQLSSLSGYLERRQQGEPVSRILGTREFWSHSFNLSPDTLDPRPDTETLVEFSIEFIKNAKLENKEFRILDLGTGSGCIILSLLSEFNSAYGLGVDISYEALQTAKDNATTLGLNERVDLVQSNWLDAISGNFDIIVSNPPYIPSCEILNLEPDVRKFDPLRALDGGTDGMDAYKEIIAEIHPILAENGVLIFEVGQNQEESIKNLLKTYNSEISFSKFSYKCDLSGITRCIATKRKSQTCGC